MKKWILLFLVSLCVTCGAYAANPGVYSHRGDAGEAQRFITLYEGGYADVQSASCAADQHITKHMIGDIRREEGKTYFYTGWMSETVSDGEELLGYMCNCDPYLMFDIKEGNDWIAFSGGNGISASIEDIHAVEGTYDMTSLWTPGTPELIKFLLLRSTAQSKLMTQIRNIELRVDAKWIEPGAPEAMLVEHSGRGVGFIIHAYDNDRKEVGTLVTDEFAHLIYERRGHEWVKIYSA